MKKNKISMKLLLILSAVITFGSIIMNFNFMIEENVNFYSTLLGCFVWLFLLEKLYQLTSLKSKNSLQSLSFLLLAIILSGNLLYTFINNSINQSLIWKIVLTIIAIGSLIHYGYEFVKNKKLVAN
jgi:hypothetical protein